MRIKHAVIEVSIVWFDDDLIELWVFGSNGNFSGCANLYIDHNDLTKLADAFRGFPLSVDDRREFVLGTFDPKYAGGGVRFRLLTADRLGHVEVEFSVRTDPNYKSGKSETAEFTIYVEPAAVDNFVAAVNGMVLTIGSVASLRGQVSANNPTVESY